MKTAQDLEQGIESYAASHGEPYRSIVTDGLFPRDLDFDEELLMKVVRA